MAVSARRIEDAPGGDALRRLIARPIHVHAARAAEPARPAPLPPEPPTERAPAVEPPREMPADLGRLKAEMLVMKAVLAAERREARTLRTTIGLDQADETLGEEARTVRDRWAALVDRILHATA